MVPWVSGSKQVWSRSFKWVTVNSCRSRGCKNIRGQSWSSGAQKKNHQLGQIRDRCARGPADLADFLSTSNFDLWYFCGPSTKSNVQYLIWKIYFISVWSQKPKVIAANLDYENLSQKTLISYHKWVFVPEWLSLAVCISYFFSLEDI